MAYVLARRKSLQRPRKHTDMADQEARVALRSEARNLLSQSNVANAVVLAEALAMDDEADMKQISEITQKVGAAASESEEGAAATPDEEDVEGEI